MCLRNASVVEDANRLHVHLITAGQPFHQPRQFHAHLLPRLHIPHRRCAGCQLCIPNCPYAAIDYDEEKKVSVITEELCKGCGTCVAGCPSGAAHQKNFEDVQIFSEIEGLLAEAQISETDAVEQT